MLLCQKQIAKFRFFLALAALSFGAPRALFAESAASTVTIEKAQIIETQKDQSGRDIIKFTGDVALTIEKGKTLITISADTVNFDRERNMLYAADNIFMEEIVSGSSMKKLSGKSLVMNTSSLEGVFDGVQLRQKQEALIDLPAETIMIVSAEVFARNDSGTVVFKRGRLTFCDDENPHWQIRASRIWLLPGNEFSLANAVLFVGRVPVMYLPFFYYPKDEMIFNPVFGYRPRAGYYTQTTTYIIGRKPLPTVTGDADGVYNFVRPSQLMEQRREGLFLRNLDTPLESSEVPHDFVRILGDMYSNLGAMGGVQASFAPDSDDSFVDSFDFAALAAVSRNLYYLENNALYSPHNARGVSEWNKGAILGVELPFRFYEDFSLKGGNDWFKLNVNFPLYSDPFFKADFFDRDENMDWISYFTSQGVSTETELEKYEKAVVDSYSWRVSGSFTPPSSTPYFKFKLDSYESYIDWRAKDDPSVASAVSPSRRFFYPSRIVPFAASATISGTLLDYKEDVSAKNAVPDLHKPSRKSASDGGSAAEGGGGSDGSGEGGELPPELAAVDAAYERQKTAAGGFAEDPFPLLGVPKPKPTEIGGWTYKLSYSAKPRFTSLYSYSPNAWRSAGDSAWGDFMSNFYSASGTASLNSALAWKNGFFEVDNALALDAMYQRHPAISDKYYATAAARDQVRLSDYKARKFDFLSKNSVVVRPFVLTAAFAETSLAWNSTVKLLRTQFNGLASAPEWKWMAPKWDGETFYEHNLTAVFAAKEGEMSQRVTLVSDLPPLPKRNEITAKFAFPHFSASLQSGYAARSATDSSLYLLPFVEEFSANAYPYQLSLTQSYKYSLDERRHESFSLGLKAGGFSLAYSSLYTRGYTYTGSGWKSDGEEKFRPYRATVKYELPKKTFFWWHNRIGFAPRLSTTLVADFLRPTASYFTFSPSFEFVISDFLQISFASEHRNDVVYRYVQDSSKSGAHIPGETNWFADLLDSFAFGDYSKRLSSGFKFKTVSVELNHNLHDWNVKSKLKIEPRVVVQDGVSRYDYAPYFSLSVVWKPMNAARASIVDEYGKLELNP